MSSLDVWKGQFGDEYTERNDLGDPSPALREILSSAWGEIDSVLEVGCNVGRNLPAFVGKQRIGVEPNARARAQANRRFTVYDAHAGALPVADGTFDLVFTAGVLIHIAPDALPAALYEIHRASRRFILAVEYEASRPEPMDYRGERAGIWKRNYGAEYMDRFPLRLIDSGSAGEPFDGCTFWLFDKRP